VENPTIIKMDMPAANIANILDEPNLKIFKLKDLEKNIIIFHAKEVHKIVINES